LYVLIHNIIVEATHHDDQRQLLISG